MIHAYSNGISRVMALRQDSLYPTGMIRMMKQLSRMQFY